MAVSPVLVQAQATSGDANSDTAKKPKKRHKKVITKDSAAEPASAPSAPTAAASTSEANSPNTAAAPEASSGPKKTKTAGNSSPEIAAAQGSGKVWVNLDSGIYHKNGRWYGKTKNGKFMSEAEAKAAGYKQSQRN